MLKIKDIVNLTHGKLLQGDPDDLITAVHFDSRQIQRKGMFIALTEGARDGHEFVQDAMEKGALAALISREDRIDKSKLQSLALIQVYDTQAAFQQLAKAYRQTLNIPVIAITGSNGKTTTKDMVAHLLSTKHQVFKTYKNLNNHLGLPLSLLQIQPYHEAAVLELGMNHAGEIDFLAELSKPSIGIITNVGEAHIEHLGSKENIAQAKGELLPHTDPAHYVLLNADDPYVAPLAANAPGQVYMYSTKKKADVYATDLTISEQGMFFRLHIDHKSAECLLPLYGEHNVSNVLPAAFIAYQSGYSLDDIAAAILHLSISDMRFEIKEGPQDSLLINDAYNASPASMKAALDTFEHIYPKRKKVAVLGDMFELGKESDCLHQELGRYLRQKNLRVITVGEKASLISQTAGGQHAQNQHDALRLLQPYLDQNHALLFKASRGMALEKLIDHIQAEGGTAHRQADE